MVAGIIAACATNAGDMPLSGENPFRSATAEGDEYALTAMWWLRFVACGGQWCESGIASFGKYLSPHWDERYWPPWNMPGTDGLLVMASGNDGVNVDACPMFPVC